MLIELLSTSNYVSFNYKLAQLLGLHTAIYLSELMSVNDRAIKKDKVSDNCFILDRTYIEERTTIRAAEQLDIDKLLMKIGILEKPSETDNTINLNIATLTNIMMAPDETLLGNIQKLAKLREKPSAEKRISQRQGMFESYKRFINTESEQLRAAYDEWIDGIYANPNGYLSKKAVITFQQKIEEFADRNIGIALKLIEIAAINGYKDATWAIDTYRKNMVFGYQPAPIPAINSKVNEEKVKVELYTDEIF